MTAFVDGSRITPGTTGCRCDTNGRACEFPCWQRIGLTTTPCCPDCAPLEGTPHACEACGRTLPLDPERRELREYAESVGLELGPVLCDDCDEIEGAA